MSDTVRSIVVPRPVRDLTRLAAWSKGLLIAQAVLAALAVVAALGHGAGFDDADGSAAYLMIASLQVILFFAAAIPVLRWIYFANANVHAFGAQGLNASPAMAVGWYFIPIANLVMPFQSMRETWKASREPRDWEVARTPALLGWWWFFWILSSAAGTAALRLELEENYAGAEPIAERLTTASDLSTIAASLLLATIIGRLTLIQRARTEAA